MNPNPISKHIKDSVHRNFRGWKIEQPNRDMLRVECNLCRVTYPSRSYLIGWGAEIELLGTEKFEVKKEYGWNAPKLFNNDGREEWSIDAIPKQLKRKSLLPGFAKAKGLLFSALEFDIRLPNGLMARWSPWNDRLIGWGEIPKKNRNSNIYRAEISWVEFLERQSLINNDKNIRTSLTQKMLLLRDPHKTVISKFETPKTSEFREKRRKSINKARKVATNQE